MTPPHDHNAVEAALEARAVNSSHDLSDPTQPSAPSEIVANPASQGAANGIGESLAESSRRVDRVARAIYARSVVFTSDRTSYEHEQYYWTELAIAAIRACPDVKP